MPGKVKWLWSINSGSNVDTSNLVTINTEQTITGAKTLGADLNANNHKVTNLATPTANTDAATKLYVDGLVGGTFQKLGFKQGSDRVQPTQTSTPQVIDFSNYDLSNGIFSFTVKTGIQSHDMSFGFYGVQITDNNSYSVLTNSIKIYNQDNTKAFDLKIERVNNHQIKLWYTNLVGGGFEVQYWGVLVKREGDLVSLTG